LQARPDLLAVQLQALLDRLVRRETLSLVQLDQLALREIQLPARRVRLAMLEASEQLVQRVVLEQMVKLDLLGQQGRKAIL